MVTINLFRLQKMISDQEDEIKEMRAIILRTGADKVAKLEDDKAKLTSDLNSFKDQLTKVNTELSKLHFNIVICRAILSKNVSFANPINQTCRT